MRWTRMTSSLCVLFVPVPRDILSDLYSTINFQYPTLHAHCLHAHMTLRYYPVLFLFRTFPITSIHPFLTYHEIYDDMYGISYIWQTLFWGPGDDSHNTSNSTSSFQSHPRLLLFLWYLPKTRSIINVWIWKVTTEISFYFLNYFIF